jgi:hypothetical protein
VVSRYAGKVSPRLVEGGRRPLRSRPAVMAGLFGAEYSREEMIEEIMSEPEGEEWLRDKGIIE